MPFPIRNAVHLCLIAVMVFQPMAAALGAAACASVVGIESPSAMVCPGCKCCEVKSSGERCGCCSPQSLAGETHSCCSLKSEGSQQDDLFGEISDLVPEPPRVEEAPLSEHPVSVSVCMCGQPTQPILPPPSRVPLLQLRNLALVANLGHVGLGAEAGLRAEGPSWRMPMTDLCLHFSQRLFCVWRL